MPAARPAKPGAKFRCPCQFSADADPAVTRIVAAVNVAAAVPLKIRDLMMCISLLFKRGELRPAEPCRRTVSPWIKSPRHGPVPGTHSAGFHRSRFKALNGF